MAKTLIHADSQTVYQNRNEWEDHVWHAAQSATGGWGYSNSDPPFSGEYYWSKDSTDTGTTSYVRYVFDTDAQTWIIAFYYRPLRMDTADTRMFRVYDDGAGTQHLYLIQETDGTITAYRGDGTSLGSTASGVVTINTWHAIEIMVSIDDSAGVVKIRVDGTLVLDLTSQDTRNGGVATADRFEYAQGADFCFGVFWTATTTNTSELPGQVRVYTLVPDTDASIAYTRSSGSDSSNLLDELNPNDSDYVESDTVGDKDLFNMESYPGSGTILGVEANMRHLKVGAGSRTARIVVNISATDYESGDITPQLTVQHDSYVWQNNPDDAAAWETADIDGADWGFKVEA